MSKLYVTHVSLLHVYSVSEGPTQHSNSQYVNSFIFFRPFQFCDWICKIRANAEKTQLTSEGTNEDPEQQQYASISANVFSAASTICRK
jgi:hypothetical protein